MMFLAGYDGLGMSGADQEELRREMMGRAVFERQFAHTRAAASPYQTGGDMEVDTGYAPVGPGPDLTPYAPFPGVDSGASTVPSAVMPQSPVVTMQAQPAMPQCPPPVACPASKPGWWPKAIPGPASPTGWLIVGGVAALVVRGLLSR